MLHKLFTKHRYIRLRDTDDITYENLNKIIYKHRINNQQISIYNRKQIFII